MIGWRELADGARPQPIEVLYQSLALPDVLSMEAKGSGHPLILIAPHVRDTVVAHLRTSNDELGGLLIGEAFYAAGDNVASRIAAIRVSVALAGDDFSSSAVSLRLGASVWSKAGAHLDAVTGQLVVGWYHSHPHIGAFFSATDRRTHRAFFAHDYSIGWVIDPYHEEANLRERMYLGADATEVPSAMIVTTPAGRTL
ncbi:MAG: Mov34/MPN/PAD-1 family protein [Burkholderiales bacterium]